jgi:hypothetical protein
MNLTEQLHFTGFTPRMHAVVAAALLLGLALLALLFFQYRDVNVWQGWAESNGLRKPSYSERIFEGSIFRTRANTWSNYAFVVVGAYALGLAWVDRKSPRDADAGYLVRHPLFSVLFGAGCVALGIGSGIFHASLTRWGQQLDVATMYPAMIALIAMNVARLFERTPVHTVARWGIAAAAVVISVLLYVYKWEMSSLNVLSTLILSLTVCGVLDVFRKHSSFLRRWITFSGLALVVAIVCRQTDVAGRFTGPDAWLQGHALWHVFCAASLGLVYLYFRSERILSDGRETVLVGAVSDRR